MTKDLKKKNCPWKYSQETPMMKDMWWYKLYYMKFARLGK
jgi:hypothetical protein